MQNDEKGQSVIKKAFKIKLLLSSGCIVGIVIFICVIVSAVLIALGVLQFSGATNIANGILSYAYEECTSIQVEGTGNAISLEDYVMGVVSAEAYASQDMEALKAQAIAARTYAIMRTDYCSKPIRNSSADQNYTANVNERVRQAVEETKGLVLTYNGNMFVSEYDSFYMDGDFSCNNTSCSVTYTKEPNGETHLITIPISWRGMMNGGHGRGMSQIMSYYLASELEYNYERILKYFYSDGVQISKLEPSSSGIVSGDFGSYTIRNTEPTANDIYFNPPWIKNSNRGQCVWYIKGRSIEILMQAVRDEAIRDQAIKAIQNTVGNAKDWWNNPALSVFGSSSDYTKPQPGAIIVWEYDEAKTNRIGANYGHVAMIESITEDGQVIVTDGWATNTTSCPNDWSCINFRSRTYNSLEEFYDYVQYNNGNVFLGYIYLLG